MKKFILTAPLTLLLGTLSFTTNLEAASCSSHKNKKVKVECSLKNDNCDKTTSEKNFNKVEV